MMNKVLVIVGPTGSGKTGLAVDTALRLDGEVISADSRAIYKGMDVGTAKPTGTEMKGIKHWGIDLVEPGERFTVADFKAYALKMIANIRARGKRPIIAGGTGLYVDALVYDYQFSEEAKRTYADREEMSSDDMMIGIRWSKDELRKRLEQRANNMFAHNSGLIEETKRLVEEYGWGSQAMTSNIYPIVWRMTQGEISLEEAKQLAVTDDWQLAKRQMTWFARNNIKWLGLDEAREYMYNIDNE